MQMHAIEYAVQLYKCERSCFYFLHAFADEVYGPFKKNQGDSFENQKNAIQKTVEKSLQELVEKLKKKEHNPKHTYKAIASFESLVDAVNDFVIQKNIDFES